MLKPGVIRELLLEELRHKGYSPNPADVGPAVHKLMELIKESEVEAISLALQEAQDKKAPVTPQKPS